MTMVESQCSLQVVTVVVQRYQPLMEIQLPATFQRHVIVCAALQEHVPSKVCTGCGQTYGTDSIQILNFGIIN